MIVEPKQWAECPDCRTAYVLRRCLLLKEGWTWVWCQDCQHGRRGTPQPKPVLVDSDGPIPF